MPRHYQEQAPFGILRRHGVGGDSFSIFCWMIVARKLEPTKTADYPEPFFSLCVLYGRTVIIAYPSSLNIPHQTN